VSTKGGLRVFCGTGAEVEQNMRSRFDFWYVRRLGKTTSGRHAAPFLGDAMVRFRRGLLRAGDASGELDLSRSRFYVPYAG
jgi:hypothetical protein